MVYHTISIARKQELVVFGKLNTGYLSVVVTNRIRLQSGLIASVKLKNPDFVVKISTNVECHKVLGTLVTEISKYVVQILMNIFIAKHQIERPLSDVPI